MGVGKSRLAWAMRAWLVVCLLCATVPGWGAVVKLAPEFAWLGAGGKAYPLKKLRGQPVVILIAPDGDFGDFRKEADRAEKLYLQFAAQKTVFIAAFSAPVSRRPGSNIPFVIAANGPDVAKAYGVGPGKFGCVVIGPDGNVDMQSDRVEGAQRILDVINNSFEKQTTERKGTGG